MHIISSCYLILTQIYLANRCPCYILDSQVQSNLTGLQKWEPRARLGIYLGHSPAHAGSVALVMNPKAGLVSPKLHVVFDNIFSMVPHI
ncbi:hypothetical protein ACHAWX_001484 [Stephanocyclus meneghinianus]